MKINELEKMRELIRLLGPVGTLSKGGCSAGEIGNKQ
mgnify:CR=1 FL=1